MRRNRHVEIVPLSTGCLGACTYCKTKHARGQLGSYDPDALIARVRQAIEDPQVIARGLGFRARRQLGSSDALINHHTLGFKGMAPNLQPRYLLPWEWGAVWTIIFLRSPLAGQISARAD